MCHGADRTVALGTGPLALDVSNRNHHDGGRLSDVENRIAPRVYPQWLDCYVFFLMTSELLIEVGNAAGIAISLCVIATWCFLEERFVRTGILIHGAQLADKAT